MGGLGVEARGGFYDAGYLADPRLVLALVCGVVGAAPWMRALVVWRGRLTRPAARGTLELAAFAALGLVLVLSSMKLAAGTYNPFIYFRF